MSSKDLIVYLKNFSFCSTYNIVTKEVQEYEKLSKTTINDLQFFEELQSLINFENVKAFICLFSEKNDISNQNYNFRLRCRDFCSKYGVFYYSPNTFQIHAYSAIFETKTMVNEGEKVLFVNSVLKGMAPFYSILKRENGYYKIIKQSVSNFPPFSPTWKKDIIGNYKPQKIIFMQYQKTAQNPYEISKMKKLFKGENLTIFLQNAGDESYLMEMHAKNILHLMNEKICEFYVKMFFAPVIEIRMDGKVLIKASYIDILPLEKSIVINVDSTKSVSIFYSSAKNVSMPQPESFELCKEIKLSTVKTKKATLTLKIDNNSFYDFQVEPIEEEIDANIFDGKTKDENVAPEKARIIFEKHYFSVSYFSKNQEKHLIDSDGLFKTPIYISFAEKKPIIGRSARDAYVEYPKCVVFDLIKLCSITSADISNPNWEFRLSKEEETISVTMETFDGEKKSSVAFLLALILKNGNDRIKKDYGKKMKDIEICFDGFSPNEILKKNFREAGKLLDVNIIFV